MVGLIEAIFLGFVQGLTEWLPVSSFGHLIIVQQLLGLHLPLLFDIALHGGTILSVFAFFWKEIWKILSAVSKFDFGTSEGRMGLFVLVGGVPVAFVGFALYDVLVPLFENLFVVGAALLVTGFALYCTKFFSGEREMDTKDALLIGISQAFSIIPGLSRSGLTISSALFRKISRQQAFAFSFLLAIPAIVGANVFELYKTASSGMNLNSFGFEMFLGASVAAMVGYVSLRLLGDALRKGRFYMFAYYCWTVGTLVLIYAYM